jgi:hypothetical protein
MARKPAGGTGQKKNPEKKAALKVDPPDAQTVNLIARYRGLSVERLFKEKDVQDFWNNLLVIEQRKKTGA